MHSAKARIQDVNPSVQVDAIQDRISIDNVMKLLEPYDLVVDGSDNFPTRFLVNDACVMLGKPLVYGAILRFEGQASVFNYKGGPNYRDLLAQPPPPGRSCCCCTGHDVEGRVGMEATTSCRGYISIVILPPSRWTSQNGYANCDVMQARCRRVRRAGCSVCCRA